MSVRVKRGRWIIEIYDVALATKRHVTQEEMRALGFSPPSSQRPARKIEREVLRERDRRVLFGREETIGTFATRWPDDYRRGKGGRPRSESTAEHNRERVRRFGQEHAARTLRSITRTDARTWANKHPSTVPALRAMFSDAVEDKLADENPFARLGLAAGHGRGDIIVLRARRCTTWPRSRAGTTASGSARRSKRSSCGGLTRVCGPGRASLLVTACWLEMSTTSGGSSIRLSAVRPFPSTTALA